MTLHLTNCLVADPEELYRLLTRCEQLLTLDGVGSRLKAPDLARLMLGPLQKLTHLGFSMVAERAEALNQMDEVEELTRGDFCVATNVRYLYVEVACDYNFDVLEAFLKYCPLVRDLHVHLVYGSFDNAVLRFARIMANARCIETFAFTSEVPPPMPPREPPAALRFGHCAAVCANVLCRFRPHSWNCARLCDLATSTESASLSERLILVAVNQPKLADQIGELGSCNRWSDVRIFCLVLVPGVGVALRATAGAPFAAPLRELFQRFTNLTELNVNSFHFDQGLDLTHALDAIPRHQLQALSLPPCGLRHNDALLRLADNCPRIQDLDLRPGGWNRVCNFCERGLYLDPACMAALSVSRRMDGRLTVYNVPMLGSLRFAASCLLAELRLLDFCENPLPDYRHLGELLSTNNRLRALFFAYTGLNFATAAFKDDIGRAKTLRYLCVVSDTVASSSVAESAARSVASSLPHLEAMHAHYRNKLHVQKEITWLCSVEDLEELPAAAVEVSRLQHRGHIYHGKPCVLCSTQTFIGLAKAHNRGRKTTL